MDTLLQPPAATAFDAAFAVLSAVVYLLVALAVLARAPNDSRARVFLAVALASAAPYCVTGLIWYSGGQAVWSKWVIISVGSSLMFGSLALLHFTQVFPWRRSWIRHHAVWLWSGYTVVFLVTFLAVMLVPPFEATSGSGGIGAVSGEIAAALAIVILVVVVPAIFVVGVAVPFAGLLSLYKSWIAARAHGVEPARVTTYWMLISQMGGGVMTILVIPLLRLVAPRGPWVTIAAALLFAFSLLMPVVFAAGVFRLRVLDLDIDALPQ